MENGKKNNFFLAKKNMLDNDLIGRGITDPAVLKAVSHVPREEFVLEKYLSYAYDDGPLPIGCGQTISQPYIVALMTQYLRPNPQCEILELGTGCGYQTAVLAKLAKKVYTIERIAQLSETAQTKLSRLGINNVEFCIGDGSSGWPTPKKFDRIIVTAAVPQIPAPLIDQLSEAGIIIVPIGEVGFQELVAAHKKNDKLIQTKICDVRFVKLIGKYSFNEND